MSISPCVIYTLYWMKLNSQIILVQSCTKKYLKNDGELDDVREELRSIAQEIYPNTKEYDDGMATEFGQAEINVQKIRNLLEA